MVLLEITLALAVLGASSYLAYVLNPSLRTVALSIAVAATGGILLSSWAPPAATSIPQRPLVQRDAAIEPVIQRTQSGYASSDTCLPCHPREHGTWQDGFHRTMTQVVTPETVLGDFNDLTLYFDGRPYTLYRSGETFGVELQDPDMVDQALALAQTGDFAGAQRFAATIPTVNRRIVMSTGSHHYQLYWYPSGKGRELYMLPFAYLINEKRWVPRVSVFLTPPNQLEPRKIWNRDCIPCHSTGGQPRYEPGGRGAPDTQLTETGIACEACHGPSLDHADLNRNPMRRYGQHLTSGVDPSVTQPDALDATRSAQVCGQCHSLNTQYNGQDWAASFVNGLPYRPGDDLAETAYVVQPGTVAQSEIMQQFVADRPGVLDEWFWADGEMRVVGREYNGLIESPCYGGGDFTCLSCHSIHKSEPDDRLKAEMRGDAACLQCHEDFSEKIAEHSNHSAGSPGARCQNCHLPHTNYGLLKASRSHRVTSPSIATDLSTGRPNACNLCHLDESRAWTAERLSEWYGTEPPPLPEAEASIPAAALWLLRGDAGVRAITAWHAGRPESQQASGSEWLAPILAPLLDDPYDAVRWIAAKSLRTLPGYAEFQYDFLDAPDVRSAAAQRVFDGWSGPGAQAPPSLFGPDGSPNARLLQSILQQRDDRPVYLVE